ncbi:glycosyltransferase family 4 protein [Ramlibacter sp. WS9]|uniref:glycosyltransferase family 4 protein n=1 Tax=Ramlibacter sp. WS9 TaxID=1882741 RepID=UPI001305144B|nr:glycosyltransferase family 4 protein [Ramlibacter sp. WS9]
MNDSKPPLRVDVVVHGRFHAFDLVLGLLGNGHDVRLITNYPRSVVRRFGVPASAVRTCVSHGIATRIYYRLKQPLRLPDLEPFLHSWFGRWASTQVRCDADVVHVFSGVAEEIFQSSRRKPPGEKRPLNMLVRGSSHIRAQHELLQQEQERVGTRVEKPLPSIIAREEREYALADRILVLSKFARDTFLQYGVPQEKVFIVGLAANLARFAPSNAAISERRRRILAREPLHVLMVGSFTPRKGARDFIELATALHGRMRFRFVGDLPPRRSKLERESREVIDMHARVSEFELAKHYAWGDVFCFPTIEDGFAAVIVQALASQLPVLTTPNCAGPDVIREGMNGWIEPIRSPERLAARLEACDQDREQLASMVANMVGTAPARSWAIVAREFEEVARG